MQDIGDHMTDWKKLEGDKPFSEERIDRIASEASAILKKMLAAGTLAAATIAPVSASAFDGFASYYTEASCKREGTSGIWTANGERFNEEALTCALPRRIAKLKYGKSGGNYLVCGPAGCAEVRHNDVGPGRKPQSKGVLIDLTPEAFKQVCGDLKQGLCKVGVMPVREE